MRPAPATDKEWKDAMKLRVSALGKVHALACVCIDCAAPLTRENIGRWSGLWCDDCDEKRVERIGRQLLDLCRPAVPEHP